MELLDGWEVAASPPGARAGPGDLAGLEWRAAQVPGTAAAAVADDDRDFDAEDWWFRTRFALDEEPGDDELVLELDGIATVSEVFVNGELVLESTSMWARHAIEVTGLLRAENELVIACRALAPLLAVRRRPAARWRTRVVNAGNLRWYRTMMFGRSPGFAPGPAAVGPWRPVRLVRRGAVGAEAIALRTRVEGKDGFIQVRVQARGTPRRAEAILGDRSQALLPTADGWLEAELTAPDVALWWPHTHGDPALHEVSIDIDDERVSFRRVGFRSLAWANDIANDGLDLRVNGIPIFARGAVWTPADLVSLAPSAAELRSVLERARDAGMNMLRVVGTGAYESPVFHDLCDELGILVWQDFMFANLDYPAEDPSFRAEVEREVRQVLSTLVGHPSLAVLCGNSEVEQQPAMLGLDPELGRGELWEELLPSMVADAGTDCAYVRSTPCGGVLPFHPERGITHYFGVSGYFRPLDDARRADVRFAAECLAFANVPDEVEFPVHHPRWKAGVPRDAGTGWDLGAGWDFDDVRDFYLGLLYGVDPVQLRRADLERYLDLSRQASGEVMAAVMGEWRREASPCRGALVLWLKDMVPGAGLGVLDHHGLPKVAYHHLRRALASVAVWTTDEGVTGVAVHAANDRPEPVRGRLRVALYRDLEVPVAQAAEELEIPAHGSVQRNVEGLLGRFVDAAWAYRFGPPGHDVIVVSLESSREPAELLSQCFTFPAGRPTGREPAERIGVEVTSHAEPDSSIRLTIRTRRLAYGVRVSTPGFAPDDDAFSVEPGGERVLRLRPYGGSATFTGGSLTALNLDGPMKISAPRA